MFYIEKLSLSDRETVKQLNDGEYSRIFQPCLLFLTKKQNLYSGFFNDIKYEQKIEILKYNLDINQINQSLLRFCIYLNQLGDFSIGRPIYPIYASTFNILLIGRPGVGKSSLINY